MNLFSELKRRRVFRVAGVYALAGIYAELGDFERAFYWLDEAYRRRSGFTILAHTHPQYNSLRADPRWTTHLRRYGIQ